MISYRDACIDFYKGIEETLGNGVSPWGIEETLKKIEANPEPYAFGAKKVSGRMGMILKKYAESIFPVPQCFGCFNESKIVAKKTIHKERKIYMRECDKDKEAMKAFEANIDKSRFKNVMCPWCRIPNQLELYTEFSNKYKF